MTKSWINKGMLETSYSIAKESDPAYSSTERERPRHRQSHVLSTTPGVPVLETRREHRQARDARIYATYNRRASVGN